MFRNCRNLTGSVAEVTRELTLFNMKMTEMFQNWPKVDIDQKIYDCCLRCVGIDQMRYISGQKLQR